MGTSARGAPEGADAPTAASAGAPFTPRASLDVAVCFGCPDESEQSLATVPSILEAIPHDAAPAVRVYVFARPAVASHLEKARSRLKFADLKIYSAPSALPDPVDALNVSNPWLVWMLRALDATAVNCVQFITHCVQVEEQGKFAFAPLARRSGAARERARGGGVS